MNNIINFNYNGSNIRTVENGGQIWWVLKDVCDILGITKYRDVAHRLDEDERVSVKVDTLGGKQNMTVVNESGLYNVILRSDKPEAKPFRKWVTSEVLPAIRKTGGYVANDDLFINTYLPYADEHTRDLFRLQLNTIRQLNNKIETDKPLVEFATQVSDTTDVIDISALSKLLRKQGLNIGRNKLFEWLRDNKYLRPNNEPYQRYINAGYFKTKESTYFVGDEPKIAVRTFVTGKGQQYIFDKLSTVNMK